MGSPRHSGHPRILEPGARVAVTCPASPIAHPAELARGAERLREIGFEVVLGETCAIREGLWAGDDATRAEELIGFLREPSIAAVFAGRGGVGCMRILPHLEKLPEDTPPKWIVGRSDLTALHVALWGWRRWLGISGPMIATDLGSGGPETVITETLRLLRDPAPPDPFTGGSVAAWRDGSSEGVLVPANLSVLSSMVGTRFLPPLSGVILVLEEIGEPPHRCDRMLTQLRLSGALDGLSGLVFGQFTDCSAREADPAPGSLETLLRRHADEIGVPTLAGIPYGHEPLFRPLPIGVRARLEGDPPGLIFLQGAGEPSGGDDRRLAGRVVPPRGGAE